MSSLIGSYGALIVSMVLAAVLGLSLYLPLMAGQLSLANPGFYALGGYIAAIVSTRAMHATDSGYTLSLPVMGTIHFVGTSFPVTVVVIEMLLAGGASALLAILVGVPALRLRGIYLALATIAFVEILRIISLNLAITGGAVGIFGVPQPFTEVLGYLWIAIPLLLLSGLFAYRLERVRAGLALVAIREDELAAASMGIDPTYNKVLAFALGAIIAGMAGALSAHFLNTWNARQGTFDASITYLAFALIGGSRSFLGPIVGGIVLTALPEALRALAGIHGLPAPVARFLIDGRLMLYGALLVAGAIFFPQGLIKPGLFDRRQRRPTHPAATQRQQ